MVYEVVTTLDGAEVLFTVRDSGPGIAAEDIGRLFRPFTRLSGAAPAEETPGSGLGLYISRAIVEAHHGRIGVESEPGAGSTFWFTLRRAET